MSTHLLALSVGPVQEFIAAARRTRDLWFGSHLLSELSKAAACAVAQQPGVGVERLVFPAPKDAADLAPSRSDVEGPVLAVANVILAELPEGTNPREVAEGAENAVKTRWLGFAREALHVVERIDSKSSIFNKDLWEEQLADAVEFYAAWTPIIKNEYGKARTRAMHLLAGRKACRDFAPAKGRQGVPKSSLDGRYETVLLNNGDMISLNIRRELRLNNGEQLSAIDLVKRQAGGTQSYPSVSRIAADPWLRGLERTAEQDDKVRETFARLKSICFDFQRRGCLSGLNASRFSQFAHFPFEGTCLFPTRFQDWKEETKLTDEDLHPVLKALDDLQILGVGEPDPYLAILVADGDHMGQLLSQMKHPNEHRDFSRRLAQFATDAHEIIEKHHGVCVFAGGDDVLALVPVDKCLCCAQALHKEFDGLRSVLRDGQVPRLSVGIAIGHCMEPLEDLRAYGKDAERAAKRFTSENNKEGPFAERNGLAIAVHPRSGVSFGVREQWQADDRSLDKRLEVWAGCFLHQDLPGKLPYDIRILARELEKWPGGAPKEAVDAEVCVLLKRKQVSKDVRESLAKKLEIYDSAAALLRLADEMLVARWIADARRPLMKPDTNENQGGES